MYQKLACVNATMLKLAVNNVAQQIGMNFSVLRKCPTKNSGHKICTSHRVQGSGRISKNINTLPIKGALKQLKPLKFGEVFGNFGSRILHLAWV